MPSGIAGVGFAVPHLGRVGQVLVLARILADCSGFRRSFGAEVSRG